MGGGIRCCREFARIANITNTKRVIAITTRNILAKLKLGNMKTINNIVEIKDLRRWNKMNHCLERKEEE